MDRCIDTYLPDYQFNEVHTKILPVQQPEVAYDAAKNLDLRRSWISRKLIQLRQLPNTDLTLPGFTKAMKFTLLEDDPPHQFMYGFWLTRKVEWITDKSSFIHQQPNEANAKVVWHFSFEPHEDQGYVMARTETRIQCLNPKTTWAFGTYWFFIRPFSGLIRREMLRLIHHDVRQRSR